MDPELAGLWKKTLRELLMELEDKHDIMNKVLEIRNIGFELTQE